MTFKILDARVQNPPQTFVDNQGVTWNISINSKCAANGTEDQTTSQVTYMAFDTTTGTIWQENAANNWYSKPNLAGTWVQGTNPLPTGQASRPYDLLRTFGYNLHSDAGGQSNSTLLINAMNYLNSTLARQQSFQNSAAIAAMATSIPGMRFSFLGMLAYTSDFNGTGTSSGGPSQVPWNAHDQVLAQLNQTGLASFFSIEGQNECNLFNSIGNASHPGTQAGWFAGNQGYAAGVRSISQLNNVPIMGLCFGNSATIPAVVTALGDVTSYLNWGNFHTYPNDGTGGGTNFFGDVNGSPLFLHDMGIVAPGHPCCITEIGWGINSANKNNGSIVTGLAGGKIALNTFLDAYLLFSAGTFIYELFDDSSEGLVLFDALGNPNQMATIIHNFTTFLKDTGTTNASFDPSSLNHTITGGTNFRKLVLQDSLGNFYVILWNTLATQTTGSNPVDVSPTPVNLTVTYNQSVSSVVVFDPTTNGTTSGSTTATAVAIAGYPKILKIAATVTPPSPIVFGGDGGNYGGGGGGTTSPTSPSGNGASGIITITNIPTSTGLIWVDAQIYNLFSD